MTFFEIRGRPRPSGSETWDAYLAKRSGGSDLKIFPLLDHCWPGRPGWDKLARTMLADRFEWAYRFFYSHPNDIYGAWLDEDLWHKERVATWPDREVDSEFWEERFKSYRSLGLSLLRDEVRNGIYLRALRDALACRLVAGEEVLFVGPTSGAEVEAIADSCGLPVFVTIGGESSDLAEERLLHDKVDYETCWTPTFTRLDWRAKYVVLSSFLPDPRATIAAAYEAIGLYGYIVCQPDKMLLVQELEALGLYRAPDPGCAVFFKDPGMPRHLGEDDADH